MFECDKMPAVTPTQPRPRSLRFYQQDDSDLHHCFTVSETFENPNIYPVGSVDGIIERVEERGLEIRSRHKKSPYVICDICKS